MKYLKTQLFVFLMLFLFFSVSRGDTFFNEFLSQPKLKLLPLPRDYRNYFFLQSIDDETHVIVGDFTGAEKLISQIVELKSDNEIDRPRVGEYMPDFQQGTRSARLHHPSSS
jgi:hypothetical protein